MVADANLFQQYLKPVRSVSDYIGDMDAREANQLALAAQRQQGELAGLQMQQTRAGIADATATRNALQQAMAGWTAATTPAERATSLRNTLSPELWKQADAIEASQRDAQKAQAEIDHKRGQTAKDAAETEAKRAEIRWKLADRHAQQLVYVKTPEDAVAYIDEGIRDGSLPQEGRERAVAMIQQMGVEAWKQRAGQAAIPVVEQFKADAEMKRAKLAADTSRANNRDTNAVTMRGQDLADARGKEANSIKAAEVAAGGKPPPGFRWVGPDRLEAIPGGPGDKLPEKQQNQVIGTQNLSNAIREYRTQLAGFGKLSALSPDQRAAMGTKYNNMMLQAKEAYNLGVLNGPDLEILTSVITDPRSLNGAITSNKALDAQAAELDRIMQGISAVSSNRRPQDAKAPPADDIHAQADAVLRGGK